MKNLLLYISRDGHTARVAQHIASTWQAFGQTSTLRSLDAPDVADCLAQAQRVVLGASIHYGHFPAQLYSFLDHYHQRLEACQCAFYGVSLSARKPGRDDPQRSAYLRRFLAQSHWQPEAIAMFAGALDYSRYPWYDKVAIQLIMAITGGPTDVRSRYEYTNWNKVEDFAKRLIDAPSARPPGTAAPCTYG